MGTYPEILSFFEDEIKKSTELISCFNNPKHPVKYRLSILGGPAYLAEVKIAVFSLMKDCLEKTGSMDAALIQGFMFLNPYDNKRCNSDGISWENSARELYDTIFNIAKTYSWTKLH